MKCCLLHIIFSLSVFLFFSAEAFNPQSSLPAKRKGEDKVQGQKWDPGATQLFTVSLHLFPPPKTLHSCDCF